MKNMSWLVLILIFCTACSSESEDRLELDVDEGSFKAIMLSEVNELRRRGCRCGETQMPPVEALQWNQLLTRAAARHAEDMYSNDFFEHRGSDGTDSSDRVSEAGYRWRAVGENIAWGYDGVRTVVEGWRDSPGHCRNIMSPNFTEIGAARRGTYWVQTFGHSR